ncbi:ABC transporter substrate-binding protein [Rhizomonospora bruguierae]|uniref:ABC transporter substrate-binding protein n=1 Tax=Rhizomonospora bruguierae TaxID=1581705 RepID=UPI001BCC0D54|nr:ABC transporter substrate-binding protein [Micromonospora sp. NBRC 107566]
MRRRSALIGVSGVALALVLAACGGGDGSGKDSGGLTTVRYGSVGGMTDGPLYLAEELGYFKDAGIKVERTRFESGTQILAAMVGGSLDVAAVAVSAGLLNAIDGSDKFKFVADRQSQQGPRRFGEGFLASPRILDGVALDDPKALGQALKGKKVAITGKSTSTEFMVGELMKSYGIDNSQVDLVVLPFGSMAAALKSGAIDAGIVLEPFMSQILNAKTGVMISHLDGVISSGTQVPVTYSKAFASGDRQVAEGFMTAFLHGAQVMNDALGAKGTDREKVIDIIAKYSDLPADVIAQSDPPGIAPQAPLDISYMADFQEFLLAQGVMKKKVDIASAVDDSFAAAARKELGIGAQ